ncbi:MAG: hypothetical protein AABY87_09445 [bacterium]
MEIKQRRKTNSIGDIPGPTALIKADMVAKQTDAKSMKIIPMIHHKVLQIHHINMKS